MKHHFMNNAAWLAMFFLFIAGCQKETHRQPDCRTDGCEAGWHCTPDTGTCAQDCTPDGCADGYCNPDTRECSPYLSIEDPALAACIEAAAGIPSKFTHMDAQSVTALFCPMQGIASLNGLEHFTSLTHLSIWENQVSDLSPLQSLPQLEELQAGHNEIQDLAPLAALASLRRLGLAFNGITDLEPLSNLTRLEYLNLDGNDVSSVAPLSGMANLRWLTLEGATPDGLQELDELADSGCEIYSDLQKKIAHQKTMPQGSFNVQPCDTYARAMFTPDGRGTGIHCQGRFLPLRSLDASLLVRRGDAVFWTRGNLSRRVGRIQNETVEWETTDDGCQMLFAGLHSPARREQRAQPLVTYRLQCPPSVKKSQETGVPRRFFVLDPLVLPSPNQYDAGSCLFMATTGAAEILLNQVQNPAPVPEGDTDLSERWLMNAYADGDYLPYFITDLYQTFNFFGRALPNHAFRFTAGWVVEDAEGDIQPATATTPQAFLSCRVNWWYELPENWQDDAIPVPHMARTLIFLDPDLDENSIWNVGIMNEDVVERIKYELRAKNAPVLLVYNHFLYWHANLIVGYDDDAETGDCPFVRSSIDYFREKGATAYASKVERAIQEQGGCTGRGAFFVRDSIYTGTAAETDYTYTTDPLVVEKYSRRIVMNEYDWARFLGNHAYALHR